MKSIRIRYLAMLVILNSKKEGKAICHRQSGLEVLARLAQVAEFIFRDEKVNIRSLEQD